MKLREYEGKELFKKYGIKTPKGAIVTRDDFQGVNIPLSGVLKAQVLSGDRKKHGGVIIVPRGVDIISEIQNLFDREISNEKVEQILIEELVDIEAEYYMSFSYDTKVRGPVMALSKKGGSGIEDADIYPIDITSETIEDVHLREIFIKSGFEESDLSELAGIAQKLWNLFLSEYALLAEINPIFKTKDGRFLAGDAKVIIDDEKINPSKKPFVSMGGDIAVLASGGGASMLNIDYLLEYGGYPANYTEYSGNPKAEVVKSLTKKVLDQDGVNGLWVIGGTANFTDIYETMTGFLEGLDSLKEKPKYPIVIRRDGPRSKEAREMLEKFGKEKGYDFHIYGGETPMHETAKKIVELAKKFASKPKS